MIDADYPDDLAVPANTPAHAESQLHSLEQAAGGIGLYVDAKKIEFMSFKQKGTISTFSGKSLKLVKHFTYLGSNILSTENDVDIPIFKVWTFVDCPTWKSAQSDEIKWICYKLLLCQYYCMEVPQGLLQN